MLATKTLLYPSLHDPHAVLGLHKIATGEQEIRLWRPGAEQIHIELFGSVQQMDKEGDEGLFTLEVGEHTTCRDYRVYHHLSLLAEDPYAFLPTLSDQDAYLFNQGVHYQLYNAMGGRVITHQGVRGAKFSVWAPNAKSVSLIAEFNHWDSRVNRMRSIGGSGIWELFIPGFPEGEKYKFEVLTQDNRPLVKSDPFAFSQEMRPDTASIVVDDKKYEWKDHEWIERKKRLLHQPQPINIYEVHLGSWKRGWSNEFYGYRQAAHELADYCQEMGYTHIELMPVAEHPLDESWGYQVTGYYAVTSRYGTPDDFKYFVDYLHQKEIGVILDWVPGHFPCDEFALARFDGTPLYEHSDPKEGYHPHWHTYIFNYGRAEVSNFLIANAIFWLKEMHVDGLRVDAVASMLYRDYGREDGEWIPNKHGGKENLEAIEFMKHLNAAVHEYAPLSLMIAEESTSFLGITHGLDKGGMGFDMKWNMGWMNDTLSYIATDPIHRKHHQNMLTFGLLYAFSERFALVLSHDEVTHGKKSLISKMPGDYWQKFANLRLLHSYMMCHPGKKLIFMGSELAQWSEWRCKSSLDWDLLQFPAHREIQLCMKELNHFYRYKGSLWERDDHWEGFSWITFDDADNSVISYLRKGSLDQVLCVHNFTPNTHFQYFIPLKGVKWIQECFHTDSRKYGGSGQNGKPIRICYQEKEAVGIEITLAPLSTVIFDIDFL